MLSDIRRYQAVGYQAFYQALSGGIGFLYCRFRGGTCDGLCSAHMGRQVGRGSRLVQNSTMDLFVCGFEVGKLQVRCGRQHSPLEAYT